MNVQPTYTRDDQHPEILERFAKMLRAAGILDPNEGYRFATPDAKAPDFNHYVHIEAPDTVANDVIRYVTREGDRVLVLRSSSPELFERVSRDYENLTELNDALAREYRRADVDDKAPEDIGSYLAIEQVAPDIVRYRQSNYGEWVVLYRHDNSKMYDRLLTLRGSLRGLRDSEDDGYRRALSDEEIPHYRGTQVGPVNEVGPDLIRYEHNGEKVIVYKGDHPKLFEYLSRLRILLENEDMGVLTSAESDGFQLAPPEAKAPPFSEYKKLVWRGELGSTGIIQYETTDGTRTAVSRVMNPQLFDQVVSDARLRMRINEQVRLGWREAGPNFKVSDSEITTFGWPEELGEGLICFQTKNNGNLIVAERTNKQLYDHIVKKREDYRLSSTEAEVGAIKTKEQAGNGQALTVDELTWKTMLEEWKSGIEKGDIKPDDDRARLYRALQAQGALEGGLDMTALDIRAGRSLVKVTPDDLDSIIDANKVEQVIERLMGSDAVIKDHEKHRKAAIDALPNKEQVFRDIREKAFAEDYAVHIQGLKNSGKDKEAKANIASTYASLYAFEPEVAEGFLRTLQRDAISLDLLGILDNLESISQENRNVATADAFKTLLTALKRAGADIPRRTVESIDKLLQETLKGGRTADALNKLLVELGDRLQQGKLDEQGIRDLIKNNPTYTSLDKVTDGNLLTTLAQLNKAGVLGSAGGMISLLSGVYQLVGKGGSLADTPEERVAIARDFISFVGAGQHFTTLYQNSKSADSEATKRGLDMLGLDRTFQDIWSENKPSPRPPAADFSPTREDVRAALAEVVNNAKPVDKDDLRKLTNLTEEQLDQVYKGYKGSRGGFIPGLPNSSFGSRVFSSTLKVLNLAADGFAGVADLVIGALKLDKAKGDKIMVADAAMTIAAGGFVFLGAGANLAGSLGITLARALAAPLFWVGAVVSFLTLGFTIYQDIKLNNALKDNQRALNDLFDALDRDDLLTDDGGVGYDFLDEYIEQYGQRDAPADQSILDYRQEEFEYFSDNGRVYNDEKHHDYDGDGPNLNSLLDRGSTVGS